MRKQRVFTTTPQGIRPHDEGWLDLDRAASVEVTSEEKDYNIESALASGGTQGWRVASPGTKRSDYSSISRKGSDAYRSSSKNPKQSERKSSSCDGLQMAGTHFEKLYASSGISARLTRYARSRNIGLKSPMSRFLNWSSFLTSVEERLAPRSRVCACLDSRRSANLLTLEEANHRR